MKISNPESQIPSRNPKSGVLAALAMLAVLSPSAPAWAQVTSDRLVRAEAEPQNWLTYSGGYFSQRYSTLTQIDRGNVKDLELAWILPNQVFGAWQATPLVVNATGCSWARLTAG
jgi:alcohol dehydrogenase (cytochrome c)